MSKFRKHLFNDHLRFDTRIYPGLTLEQLNDIHEVFHDDGWMSKPHRHWVDHKNGDGDSVQYMENEFQDYVDMIVKGIKEGDPE